MPCSDYEEKLKARADKGTRLLCELMGRLDGWVAPERSVYISRELEDWWSDHKSIERQREEAARESIRIGLIKNRALSKLTEEEKKVLGL